MTIWLARSTGDMGTKEAGATTARTSEGWLARAKGRIFTLLGRTCTRRMELVEKLELGGRRQLMLVTCDGQTYLVGAGNDGIHAITRVEVKPEGNPILGQDAPCNY